MEGIAILHALASDVAEFRRIKVPADTRKAEKLSKRLWMGKGAKPRPIGRI